MNKQELIEKINNLSYILTWNIPRINREIVIDLIEQLDKPQKPVVPQFVADWYEENKDNLEINIFNYVYIMNDNDNSTFKKWFVDSVTKPFQTLVNMHQFGYEVEKEKRYTVKMRATKQPLFYNNMYEKIFFSLGDLATRFTRKELEEAGLGWVFDCPGMEVEEVE